MFCSCDETRGAAGRTHSLKRSRKTQRLRVTQTRLQNTFADPEYGSASGQGFPQRLERVSSEGSCCLFPSSRAPLGGSPSQPSTGTCSTSRAVKLGDECSKLTLYCVDLQDASRGVVVGVRRVESSETLASVRESRWRRASKPLSDDEECGAATRVRRCTKEVRSSTLTKRRRCKRARKRGREIAVPGLSKFPAATTSDCERSTEWSNQGDRPGQTGLYR